MQPQILNSTLTDKALSEKHRNYKPSFLVEGIIKEFGKNIVAAERGTGKTRLLLWLAYCMVYEYYDFLGYKIICFGDILYVNLEIPEKDFKAFTDPIFRYFENKLLKQRKHTLNITSFREGNFSIHDLKIAVLEHKPMLTVIDSYKLYQALICSEKGHKEINNSNFNAVLRPLDELIKECGTTIVLINHTNKGSRKLESNADLMYGPGALPDFADQVTLFRKTKNPNQRIIVPDKSRYCGEGYITSNLIEIESTDLSAAYPDLLFFSLKEKDVNESEYLPIIPQYKIDDDKKEEIISYMKGNVGTMEQAAEKFLGNPKLKGTISRIMKKDREKS